MLKIFQMVPQAEKEHLCQFGFSQFCFCFSWQWNQEELWLCVVCLFFNFTQQRIKVQIQVFILHIPLSTALCQGSVSRIVVYCDAVLFIIALLNRKIGETWKYVFCLVFIWLKMVHVYKFIGISPVFMKVVILLPFWSLHRQSAHCSVLLMPQINLLLIKWKVLNTWCFIYRSCYWLCCVRKMSSTLSKCLQSSLFSITVNNYKMSPN